MSDNKRMDFRAYCKAARPSILFCSNNVIGSAIQFLCERHYKNIRLVKIGHMLDISVVVSRLHPRIYMVYSPKDLSLITDKESDRESIEGCYFDYCLITDFYPSNIASCFGRYYGMLSDYLPAGYAVCKDCIMIDDTIIYVYAPVMSERIRSIGVVMGESMGYGDLIMIYPILNEFIKSQVLPVTLYCANNKIFDFCPSLFPQVKHLLCPPKRDIDHFIQQYDDNSEELVYNIEERLANAIHGYDKHHYIEMIAKCLEVTIKANYFDHYDTWALKRRKGYFAAQAYEIHRTSQQKVIAIQFHSDSSEEKCWSASHAQQFIAMCHHSGYSIVSLDIFRFYDNVARVPNEPLLQVYNIMSEIDLFVGIDSCCGHIAASLNIPNITLWGRNSPTQQYIDANRSNAIGFRTLRKNISICASQINDISPMLVYSVLKNVVMGTLVARNALIDYKASQAGDNIFTI